MGVCVDKFVQKLSFKKVKKITKYVVVVVCLGDDDDGEAVSFLSDMHLGANVFKSKSKQKPGMLCEAFANVSKALFGVTS